MIIVGPFDKFKIFFISLLANNLRITTTTTTSWAESASKRMQPAIFYPLLKEFFFENMETLLINEKIFVTSEV